LLFQLYGVWAIFRLIRPLAAPTILRRRWRETRGRKMWGEIPLRITPPQQAAAGNLVERPQLGLVADSYIRMINAGKVDQLEPLVPAYHRPLLARVNPPPEGQEALTDQEAVDVKRANFQAQGGDNPGSLMINNQKKKVGWALAATAMVMAVWCVAVGGVGYLDAYRAI
jgi:hypothetical protein